MKFIKNPNDIVDEYVGDYLDLFGDGLKSIVMYGSAVSHEFKAGKSDINMALFFNDISIHTLSKASIIQEKWLKKGVNVPFYFVESQFVDTCTNFPLEILDMKSNYRVLQGQDFLNDIEPDNEQIKKQCERELRRISIHLRRLFVTHYKNENRLFKLLNDSMRDLIPVLKGIVVLYGESIPNSKSEIVAKVEDLINLGISSLSEVFNIANNVKKIDIKELVENYCNDIDKMISIVLSPIQGFNDKDNFIKEDILDE